MSKLIDAGFLFDEPPCFCKGEFKWSIDKGTLQIWCTKCIMVVTVPHHEFMASVKFKTKEKKYDVVGNCKIIPFKRK